MEANRQGGDVSDEHDDGRAGARMVDAGCASCIRRVDGEETHGVEKKNRKISDNLCPTLHSSFDGTCLLSLQSLSHTHI